MAGLKQSNIGAVGGGEDDEGIRVMVIPSAVSQSTCYLLLLPSMQK